jgi:septum formation protein
MQPLILASASPRRLELLTRIGVVVEVIPCDLPEVRAADESPLGYSQRVSREKALAGWIAAGMHPQRIALGADTEVVLGDRVFGKPVDADAARAMLADLSGREHLVLTSVALRGGGIDEVLTSSTRVRFARLTPRQIEAYVASGEAMGRAGAYAIQGLAGCFIEHIDGSYSGVMGLPLFETTTLLRQAGMFPLAD